MPTHPATHPPTRVYLALIETRFEMPCCRIRACHWRSNQSHGCWRHNTATRRKVALHARVISYRRHHPLAARRRRKLPQALLPHRDQLGVAAPSQTRALTTDHETWHCINVFINAYRKTSPARCLATSSLSCMPYEWHEWTCHSPQFIMLQFKCFMHESFRCLMVVVVSCVCCTKTPTNKHTLNISMYQQTTRHGIAQMIF
jgi:hypothetical protein